MRTTVLPSRLSGISRDIHLPAGCGKNRNPLAVSNKSKWQKNERKGIASEQKNGQQDSINGQVR